MPMLYPICLYGRAAREIAVPLRFWLTSLARTVTATASSNSLWNDMRRRIFLR